MRNEVMVNQTLTKNKTDSKEYAVLLENISRTRRDTQMKFYKVVARPTLL